MMDKAGLLAAVAMASLVPATGLAQEGGPAQDLPGSRRDVPASALLQRIEALEARSEALMRENAALRAELAALKAALADKSRFKKPPSLPEAGTVPPAGRATAAAGRTDEPRSEDGLADVVVADRRIGLGGQYRVNGYVVDDDVGGLSRAAARLRLRQNLDFDFGRGFASHLQFELSHTSDNVTTTSESSRGTNVDIRHAVLSRAFPAGVLVEVGILPLSDRFFDTQYSSDWDYNPLAVSLTAPMGPGELRAFAANLDEGQETVADDFLHFGLDYRWAFPDGWVNVGAQLVNAAAADGRQQEHATVGISASLTIAEDMTLSGFMAASWTDRALLAATRRGRGLAAGLRLSGAGGWELLATHATGRRDGTGFLPLMALARTYGYWGLTGLLTVQGPTDTGFDGDGVNISNNGFGLTSIQGRYQLDLARDWRLALAAGWFGNSRTPRGRSGELGIDLLAMASWRITDVLGLDIGLAYAHVKDGVSGYFQGVIGGTAFNGPAGVSRDKIAGFTRLQAEFH